MKKPRRKFRIGLRGWIDHQGYQWVTLYLMRFRTCLHGHDVILDGTEEQNRRRVAIVWKFCREAAKEAAAKSRKKRRCT